MTDEQFAPLPTSTATNLYDLMTDVIRAIEEEPKRLDMQDWYIPPGRASWLYEPGDRPACGTIACVAGWMVILAKGPQWVADVSPGAGLVSDVAYKMLAEAGLDEEGLFSANLTDENDEMIHRNHPRYIPLAVARIREYRDRHAIDLKSTPILR